MYPEIRKHAWLMHPLKVVQEGQKTPFSFWKNPRVPCFLKKKLLFIVRVQITTIDNRGHLIYISETSMSIMKYNDQTMKSEKGNMRLFPLHHSGSSLSWWSRVYQMKLPEAKEHSDLSLHASLKKGLIIEEEIAWIHSEKTHRSLQTTDRVKANKRLLQRT